MCVCVCVCVCVKGGGNHADKATPSYLAALSVKYIHVITVMVLDLLITNIAVWWKGHPEY